MNGHEGPFANLRILATSDLHGDLLGVDYFERDPAPDTNLAGFARCASLIRSQRQVVANSILLDNGDLLQGTPLSDVFFETDECRETAHPLIAAMNSLGYDAAALGNHEFTFGLAALYDTLRFARFPFLCANLHGATPAAEQDWRNRVNPHCLIVRKVIAEDGTSHDLKVGLFAVLPPAVLKWEATRIGPHLGATPMLDAARVAVGALQAAGADIVIALAHSGLVATGSDGQGENVGADIAQLPGVDALIAGHTHEVFPAPDYPEHNGIDAQSGLVHGVPTVMAGSGGSHLGQIDLRLAKGPGGWRVAAAKAAVLPVAGQQPDRQTVALASPFHRRTTERIAQPVATLPHPVHSYFALLTEDLSTRIVAEAKAAIVREQLAATALAHLPVLGTAAPFKSGGPGRRGQFTDVAAGIVTERDIADMQLYPNDVAALVLNGDQLRDWLDMAAGQYAHVLPFDRDKPLIQPLFPSYNRDLVSGVTFEIDLSVPSRFSASGVLTNPEVTRIVDLRFRGHEITSSDRFVIATNNYRAGGGGHFPGIAEVEVVLTTEIPVRQALTRFLREGKVISDDHPGWRFAPLPGATTLFETHPRARPHLDALPWLDLTPVAETADTLTLRLSLDRDSRLASPPNRDYIGA